MTQCDFLRKQCKGGCEEDWYVCRAFFPDRQPRVAENQLEICQSDEFAEECLQYGAGKEERARRKRESLDFHCPYASNSICGRPWLWQCKARTPPFFLTLVRGEIFLPERDEGGAIIYDRSVTDLKDSCFSGKMQVYADCPFYKQGEKDREEYRFMKGISADD